MTIIMYGIRDCDIVRKARAWLERPTIDNLFHGDQIAVIERRRLDCGYSNLGRESLLNLAFTQTVTQDWQ